jgi:hypothetical protein
MWSGVLEFEAVSRSVMHCPGIWKCLGILSNVSKFVLEFEVVSRILRQCPRIWHSVVELQAVSRNLKHCTWILGNVPEFVAVARNVKGCSGIWSSFQEFEAVSSYLRQWLNLRQFPGVWTTPNFIVFRVMGLKTLWTKLLTQPSG